MQDPYIINGDCVFVLAEPVECRLAALFKDNDQILIIDFGRSGAIKYAAIGDAVLLISSALRLEANTALGVDFRIARDVQVAFCCGSNRMLLSAF